MEERPKIGVGVIVTKNGKVLLGKRKKSPGDGTWAFPGGHLELNETPEECAERETLEEAGVRIKNIRRAAFTNDIFEKEGKHYITLFLVSEHEEGEPEVMEPDKCEGWDWFEWENMPQPLLQTIQSLLKQGYNPFC